MFSALISELAGSVGGGLLDQMTNLKDSATGFMDDPAQLVRGSALDFRDLFTDPENYMNKRIQEFEKNQGRAPTQSEFARMQSEMDVMREQAMQTMQAGQIPMQMGGFVNQNPSFLNTAQRRLG